MLKVALIGSPNAGKTTLFNKLTSSTQAVANRPGVTVAIASSVWKKHDCEIIDLPGCHSISQIDIGAPYDEQITATYVLQNHIDYIINVVDIARLESSLYLTTQLLETNIPMLIVISKKDLAKKLAVHIDIKLLASKLKAPVMTLDITENNDIIELSHYLKTNIKAQKNQTNNTLLTQCSIVKDAVNQVAAHIKHNNYINKESIALNMLAGATIIKHDCQKLQQAISHAAANITKYYNTETDIAIAQNRYNFIKQATATAVISTQKTPIKTNKIDSIVTHPIFGIPILITTIIVMFWFTISFGGLLQECFTLIGEALFIEGTAAILQVMHAPTWTFMFLVNGIGHGITTLIAFIPIVATIFYTMDLLDQSGYMARAAFITDKLMRYLQLPGKAFIPLIISFGCNVPGILATRTLTSQRERLITGIMTPFMSCNARLAVFAVFASIFFPHNSLKVIMSLYFIGILVAIVTGIMMSKFILPGNSERLVMEMPTYQIPKQKELILSTIRKTQNFCIRVGKYILISSAIIGIFSQVSVPQGHNYINIIELIGKSITPIFEPIGITSNNWQATIALISGFIAKETTIITLDQLYSHSNSVSYIAPGAYYHYLINVFYDAAYIIYNTIAPWQSTAADSNNTIILHHQIKQHFISEAAAWSYLLFNLLYMPCISTVITFAKECGWSWAGFSITWSFSAAYIIASLNYQFSQQHINLLTTMIFIAISIAFNLVLAKTIVKHTSTKIPLPL
jgi:ferrous iron transport protein B